MARARTQAQKPPQDASAAEEEIAAAIALVLAGQALPAGTTPLVAVAALLRLVPGLGDGDISERVASMVVGDRMPLSSGSQTILKASASNISYRAHYAIEAAKRVAGDIASGKGITEAFAKERPNLIKHLEKSRRNITSAKNTEAMAELYGHVLSWNHGATGHPAEPRPLHLAADGANFDTRLGVPKSTGALPAVESDCTCAWGPPKPNARTLR